MKVFIVGITGTLGTAVAEHHHKLGYEVAGCARNESKCVKWIRQRPWARVYVSCATNLVWDVSTPVAKDFLASNRVYLLSALKHIDICEKQPHDAIHQNVAIPSLVSEMCNDESIPLVFSSTDKAYQPSGVYGSTKLIAENIVISNNGVVVRLANIIGSSGSVFDVWKDCISNGAPIRITHPEMTRFFMTREHAADILATIDESGRVFVPVDIKAASIRELAAIVSKRYNLKVSFIGLRPGEAVHQQMSATTETSERAPRWDSEELLRLGGIEV